MIDKILQVYRKSLHEEISETEKEGTRTTKTVKTETFYQIDKEYRDILVKELLKHNNIKF